MGRGHGRGSQRHVVLAQKGIRTEVILKADVRPGFENMMEQKVRSVDAILESDVADGDAEKGE